MKCGRAHPEASSSLVSGKLNVHETRRCKRNSLELGDTDHQKNDHNDDSAHECDICSCGLLFLETAQNMVKNYHIKCDSAH